MSDLCRSGPDEVHGSCEAVEVEPADIFHILFGNLLLLRREHGQSTPRQPKSMEVAVDGFAAAGASANGKDRLMNDLDRLAPAA